MRSGRIVRWIVAGVLWFSAAPVFAQALTAIPEANEAAQDRISLDLKGVDILDVLKLLSQKSGFNFVAGRNVTGRVTIFVHDVGVWEAFERIIAANDLAYERHGEIITVMTARDYELIYGEKYQERKERLMFPLRYAKAVQVATALNQLKSAIGQVVVDETSNTIIIYDVPSRLEPMREALKAMDRPTETRIFHLDYADVEQLKEKCQEYLSSIGTLTVDARTHTIFVTDLTDVLDQLEQMIHAFDTPGGGVLIEAKIVKVDLVDIFEMGVDWKRVFSGIDTTGGANFDVVTGDVIGGTAEGFGVKLLTGSSDASLVIEALRKLTRTETIASPRIMVSDSEEARILVGTKEVFVTTTTTVPATGSTISAPSIEFVDVGTKLFVTPHIKRDGYVQLHIRPEVSSAEITTFLNNRIPIVTSTEAETTVLVKSGVTVIIGGLISEVNTKTNTRVPILGDIPILGIPFRGTTDRKDKTELVVFITPQIILPDGSHFAPKAKRSIPSAVPSMSMTITAPEVFAHDPLSVNYRRAIRSRLEKSLANQFRVAELGSGFVVVSFLLGHDGRLVEDPSATSPQGSAYVAAAQAALRQAEPFPAFPAGASASEVRFRLAVEYVE